MGQLQLPKPRDVQSGLRKNRWTGDVPVFQKMSRGLRTLSTSWRYRVSVRETRRSSEPRTSNTPLVAARINLAWSRRARGGSAPRMSARSAGDDTRSSPLHIWRDIAWNGKMVKNELNPYSGVFSWSDLSTDECRAVVSPRSPFSINTHRTQTMKK